MQKDNRKKIVDAISEVLLPFQAVHSSFDIAETVLGLSSFLMAYAIEESVERADIHVNKEEIIEGFSQEFGRMLTMALFQECPNGYKYYADGECLPIQKQFQANKLEENEH